jgi:hypothetical protein
MLALDRVSREVGLYGLLLAFTGAISSGVFGSDDHLIPHTTLLHSVSDSLLGFLQLIDVRSINEIPALLEESIKNIARIIALPMKSFLKERDVSL